LEGRSGRSGESKQDITIFADRPYTLNLSGTDGEDGEGGRDATGPNCDRHHRDRDDNDRDSNIQLASGNSGGSGGNGGNGGNAGNLTIYYKNLIDLRSILVQAVGGRGGRGGRGGVGTQGCQCRRYHWTREVCTGKGNDRKCETKTFTCTSGSNGSNGSNGSDGSSGSNGTLFIAQRQDPIPADQPSLSRSLAQMREKPLKLSLNVWDSKSGALSVLAPGSVINDRYYEFREQLQSNFKLVWNSRQPVQRFNDLYVGVTLNRYREVSVSFPSDVWMQGSQTEQDGTIVYQVNSVVRQADVARLSVGDFARSGKDLTLSLVDLGGNADVLNTEFKLRYRAKPGQERDFGGFSKTYFEGVIPASAIKRDYNRYLIQLGQLPIPAEVLEAKTDVEIEVVATRSLGNRSAEQKISWQGEVRGDR
jgi:hypothetical protein